MKILTYLILAVIGVLTLSAIVFALISAVQVLVYAALLGLILWGMAALTSYINRNNTEPPD